MSVSVSNWRRSRQGHGNPVGINYLEKIQTPHLVAIYGAMLAGVGYVLMGAGIPLKIPAVLDACVNHQPASYPLYVVGAQDGDDVIMHFTPRDFIEGDPAPLARPRGKLTLNAAGEPIYGERDVVDLVKMRDLGVTFWLAGGRFVEAGIGTSGDALPEISRCMRPGSTTYTAADVIRVLLAGD